MPLSPGICSLFISVPYFIVIKWLSVMIEVQEIDQDPVGDH